MRENDFSENDSLKIRKAVNQDKRKMVHRKIFHILLVTIVFFIPVYGRVIPILITLLFLNWLAEGTYIQTFPLLLRDKNRFVLISFLFLYLIYLAGLSYSSNLDYGSFDMEVKLSLLIFPLIFATSESIPLPGKIIKTALAGFIAGCFFSTLLLYGHAIYTTVTGQGFNMFYYSNLSWYFHPTYLALYHVFAIAVLINWFTESHGGLSRNRLVALFLILNSFVFALLLNSKAGYISLFIVFFFYAFYFTAVRKKRITGPLIIVIPVSLFIGSLILFPYSGQRLKQAGIDLQSADAHDKDPKSTAERIAVWKASLEIIREHPFFGVGTGDVKDALLTRYKADDFPKGLRLKLNAHNQYLQTLIAIGVIGEIVLLYMLVFPAVLAFREKKYLYFLFIVIFALNITVESMFEIQAGVVFYALFNALLFASGSQAFPASGVVFSEKT